MILKILLALMLVLSVISCTDDKPVPPDAIGERASQSTGAQGVDSKSDKVIPSGADLPQGAFSKTTGKQTLQLLPEKAYVNTTFKLVPKGMTLPDGDDDDRVIWYINGSPVVSYIPGVLDISEHMPQKGDVVQAQAVVGGKKIFSNPVVLINYRPQITKYELRGRGDDASGGVHVIVEAEDIDGDLVSIEYKWFLNDQPVGTGPTPDIQPTLNDKVTVNVRAYDGQEYSEELFAEADLLNQPPHITEDPAYYFVNNVYIYNTTANEPDGELMTFSLESAPAGMTIDSETGQVRWPVPSDFLGTVEFKVVAMDTQGARAWLPLKFSITQQ